ncbi:zinc finger and BTB domain-containing protein 38 [Chanos chanos]|uniref:Zinc finger and BTB domain-containing protein 38 n=1 Tax=Chanos chanos TaxID=29144 RepID=A0A6J2UPP8_CHACN|nr:zinc finger and BTB domain-containing protein 38 [Chanos chanos]
MTVVSPSTHGLTDNSHPQAVLSRLSEQQSHGLFCDVTIVVEDVKFRAHRNILAATSGYFRNAFTTPDMWTSGQVLELLDLKSEVFASILNFIYNARVESSSLEDRSSLVAAGRRLGIPFLEKLLESDRPGSGLSLSQATTNTVVSTTHRNPSSPHTLKRETSRPEEPECSRGPRITNAFSMTEVGAGNNPFTPADSRGGGHQSPNLGHHPASCATSSMPTVEKEPAQTLSEHSYAVSQDHKATELNEDVSISDNKASKPALIPPKTPVCRNLGPLKKRHRLGKDNPFISDVSGVSAQADSCPVLQKAPHIPPESPLPLVSSDPNTETCPNPKLLSQTEDVILQEAEPPSLSPQDTPNIPTYHCQHCPEAFNNRALLTIHMQIHKKRFVSHLFCKYCHRKFMHLKRLRNHEQVCKKPLKDPPQLEPNGIDASTDTVSENIPDMDDTSLSPPNLQDPLTFNLAQTSPLEATQVLAEHVGKASGGPRTYKCSVCKRAYVTLSSLKRHENVHSWQRAYPCHYCNKVFALAEYRTKHEIWHTGERRYQCIFCLETFMTYYILKNHQKSFHGIDPRLAVNKKSANGGFKSNIYPIKLYRLLPMKFRKRQYKTYSQTYSDIESQDQSFTTSLGSSSHTAPIEGGTASENPDGVCSGRSLFSMPVTFMATPKMVAPEIPRISFEQPCDQNIDPSELDRSESIEQSVLSSDVQKETGLSGFEQTGSSLFTYGYTAPSVMTQESRGSSIVMQGNDVLSLKGTDNNGHILPFQNKPSISSFEGLSRLGDISATAHTIETMANQLLLPRTETLAQSRSVGGKTETYIAKPACPGPSIDSQVLPLCQITVKIGNEAIIRRKIKGSKLFPRKKKRRSWRHMESKAQSNQADDSGISPSLHLRTEVSTSMADNDQFDDPADPDNDKPWRPYYSYKPKRKGKKLRSKQRKVKTVKCYTRPLSPEADEDFTETDCSPGESILSESREPTRLLRNDSSKPELSCYICKTTFFNLTSLEIHLTNCHHSRCRTCGKKMTSSSSGSFSEDNTDFTCKSCMEDGSCFSSDMATQNLSMEKRYRCSFCPQRFLYLATKRSHEKKHLEKSYQHWPQESKSPSQVTEHKPKQFLKSEEGDYQEDSEMESKGSAGAFSSFMKSREQPKIEPWDSTEIRSPVGAKMEDPENTESKGTDYTHKKTSLFSHGSNGPLSTFPAEMMRIKHKKRSILERSKSFGLDSHRQDSRGEESKGQKGCLPKLGTNYHLNTARFYPTCLTRDPVTKEAKQQLPISKRRLCKEEFLFNTNN